MDNNSLLGIAVSGIITACSVLGLVIKSLIDGKKNGNGNGNNKQATECAVEHTKVLAELAAIRQTLNDRQPLFEKLREQMLDIKSEVQHNRRSTDGI